MTAVIRAAAELQRVCEAEGWRYCFIGGLAVLRWGEPRETVDVDLIKEAPEILQTLERRRSGLAD